MFDIHSTKNLSGKRNQAYADNVELEIYTILMICDYFLVDIRVRIRVKDKIIYQTDNEVIIDLRADRIVEDSRYDEEN